MGSKGGTLATGVVHLFRSPSGPVFFSGNAGLPRRMRREPGIAHDLDRRMPLEPVGNVHRRPGRHLGADRVRADATRGQERLFIYRPMGDGSKM